MKKTGTDRTTEQEERLERLAEDILDVTRNRLLVNLRYMDIALSFHGRAVLDGTIGTDGRTLYYCPLFVLQSYRDSREELTRAYLHSVLHCVFHHQFVSGAVDRRLWDLACDIAVESTITELALVCAASDSEIRQQEIIRKIRREAGYLTAEKIYAGLRRGMASDVEIAKWEELFRRDDHSLWYEEQAGDAHDAGKTSELHMMRSDDSGIAEEWKDIAERIEMDVEMFAKVRGKYASSLVQNLRAVTREHYDYSDFLRKFASVNETVKVSEDEFDYIYYTYGLSEYGNMPLIEPLEYREDSRIHDFAIAIDTSGSVAGEEVQKFLQKTYNILRSRESFDSRVNVHIIQCDAEIQSDEVITCPEDFDRYIETMEIRGLGGTDFRPVFSYVDDLVSSGDLQDMRGLIYFTDGLGTFPASMPEYRTAFVFLESGYSVPEVPPWAMKVVLDPDEL